MTFTTAAFDRSSSWLFGSLPLTGRLRRVHLHLSYSTALSRLLDTTPHITGGGSSDLPLDSARLNSDERLKNRVQAVSSFIMRLGFHYHVPAYLDNGGQVRMPGYQGRFLDALAAQVEEVICFLHSPRMEELQQMDYVVKSGNVRLVNQAGCGKTTSSTKNGTYSLR